MRIERNEVVALLLFVTLGLGFAVCCDDWDPECGDACEVLVDCENEWLFEDGEDEMNELARKEFYSACMEDCSSGDGGQADIDCVYEASCDELAEGDCI